MPINNFTQIWEDNQEEEWEVEYHLEGNDEPWLEIDSVKSISDGRAFEGDQEPILNYITKNHDFGYQDDYADFYGELD